MILADIINQVYRVKQQDIAEKRHVDINIYIDRNSWFEMMNNLRGKLSSVEFSIYQSHGKKLMDYNIYQVISNEPHLQIYEVKK